MNLVPESVFVTGAGSGIGRATSLRFAAMGAAVIPTDIDIETVQETAELVRRTGGRAHPYRLDVTDAASFEALAEEIRLDVGVPDVVVNNAGIVMGGTFLEHSMEDWKRVLDVHLMGVVHGSRLFGAQLVARGRGGHIVNISSIGGIVPFQVGPAYCTAKAAIKMLSECLHVELAQYGIGVTAICPGLINTNIVHNGALLDIDDELYDRTMGLADAVMPVLGSSPEKVAKAIVRAVEHNHTIVPVTPEAWLGAAAMRIAPGLTRTAMRFASKDNAIRLERLIPGRKAISHS